MLLFPNPDNQGTFHAYLAQQKVRFLSHVMKELNKKFLLREHKQEAVQFNEVSKQLEAHYTFEIRTK